MVHETSSKRTQHHKYIQPDIDQARRFLTLLDDTAGAWCFQTFDDSKKRKDPSLARVLNGTLDEHWTTLCELSRRGAGVFVAVQVTDGKGRKAENITKVRCVFQEQDGEAVRQLPLEEHICVESSPRRCS